MPERRTLHSLPIFVRLTGRPVILVGDGDAAAAKRRLLDRAGVQIVGEDAAAALAIVAIDDDAAALGVINRLKARGVLVNAVDRPAECDFTLPAIVDRDPVIVAIGTGGASAGLAKALRQRFEMLLPMRLGALAVRLHDAREVLRNRYPDPATRRNVIDAALSDGGALDPLSDAEFSEDWMDIAVQGDRTESIRIVSDDADDLTLRQARLLAQADTVVHDGHVASAILDRARADAVRIAGDVASRAGLTVVVRRG